MSHYEDAIKQLELILNNRVNKDIKILYEKELKKTFLGIYAINYLSNRIEINNFFISSYYDVTFSCLLESFSLITNNYPRGSSLVLRSGLENFLKYIIETLNNINKSNYIINDRSYSENKKTLETIINDKYILSLKEQSISLNSKMETQYKKLSALSHSLVPESKNNTINYFSEIDVVSKSNLDIVFENFLSIVNQMFSFCIIICQSSLKSWDSIDLEKILRMVFGKHRTLCFLTMLKA